MLKLWADNNKAIFAPNKSEVIGIRSLHYNTSLLTCDSSIGLIKGVSTLKILGVTFDETLTFIQHATNLASKFKKTLFFSNVCSTMILQNSYKIFCSNLHRGYSPKTVLCSTDLDNITQNRHAQNQNDSQALCFSTYAMHKRYSYELSSRCSEYPSS